MIDNGCVNIYTKIDGIIRPGDIFGHIPSLHMPAMVSIRNGFGCINVKFFTVLIIIDLIRCNCSIMIFIHKNMEYLCTGWIVASRFPSELRFITYPNILPWPMDIEFFRRNVIKIGRNRHGTIWVFIPQFINQPQIGCILPCLWGTERIIRQGIPRRET